MSYYKYNIKTIRVMRTDIHVTAGNIIIQIIITPFPNALSFERFFSCPTTFSWEMQPASPELRIVQVNQKHNDCCQKFTSVVVIDGKTLN